MNTVLPVLAVYALLLPTFIGTCLLVYRQKQHQERTEDLHGAILATLAAEEPRPIGYHTHDGQPVLDARDLTDEQLFEEVLRRNSGHHDPDEQT